MYFAHLDSNYGQMVADSDQYRFRGRIAVEGRWQENVFIYNQAGYDKKYCLKTNHFVQICVECQKIGQGKDDEYRLVFRKGEFPLGTHNDNDNDNDNDDDKDNNDQKKEDIVQAFKQVMDDKDCIAWQDEDVLNFNQFEYAFAISSMSCSCSHENNAIMYQVFVCNKYN